MLKKNFRVEQLHKAHTQYPRQSDFHLIPRNPFPAFIHMNSRNTDVCLFCDLFTGPCPSRSFQILPDYFLTVHNFPPPFRNYTICAFSFENSTICVACQEGILHFVLTYALFVLFYF